MRPSSTQLCSHSVGHPGDPRTSGRPLPAGTIVPGHQAPTSVLSRVARMPARRAGSRGWVEHTPTAHSRRLSRASTSTPLYPTWPIAQSPDSTHSQSVGFLESWHLKYRQKKKKRKEPFPYIIVNPAHDTRMPEISHSNYLNQIKIRFQISIPQG